MAKNIEMQYYNGSEYEAIYPKTLSENVINKDGTTLEDFVNIFNYHTWFRTPYENKTTTYASSYTTVCLSDSYYSSLSKGASLYVCYSSLGVNILGEIFGAGTSEDTKIYYILSETEIKNKLLNKYFNKGDTWYFVDSGSASSRDTGGEGYRTFITAKQVSIVDNTINGTAGYVTSSSSSTYPTSGKSGGYEYFYLGTPQQYLINKNIRIKTGTYTGTGLRTTENYPIELSFDFIPLFFMILQSKRDGEGTFVIRDQTILQDYNGRIFLKDNKVYIYGIENEVYFNSSNVTYFYTAIGY